ncbi:sodium/hydrogen exchanger [Dermatophagoides farinae]|uniref:Sodium/hydrogen exchanger n=1 Tax=Dermatophagoides farinae TaxID=6954 RepID=A0A9D4P1G8_DERFA|nr:sodium/hydrogen exchanger [Dermatophagoides farinae]
MLISYIILLILACIIGITFQQLKTNRIARWIPEPCLTRSQQWKPTFTAELFFNILLPPIILESAFALNHRQFYRNLLPILLYAIMGTLINIILIGTSLYIVMNIHINATLSSISALEMMIFSTSISAIDPVCVLALFKDFKVEKSLYYLVFGESLLNDAVVLVVHKILLDAFHSNTSSSFSIVTLLSNGLIEFTVVSFGSLIIGLFHGILTTIFTKTIKIEPILVIILAYGSYMISELIGWSGVMSIIACGLSEYALVNVSSRSRITIKSSIESLSSICDKIIFIFLGMVLIQNEHNWNWIFISYAIIFCIFYRFIAIIMLTFFVNHYWISRWSKLLARRWIKFKEQILLVHVGLRGAIAFALISTSYNGQEINHHEEYISKLESTKTIMDRNFFWQQHQHLLAYRLVDILIFIRKNQLCMKDKSILSRILIFWNKYYQKNNNDGSSYINCYDLQSKSSSPINMSTYHLFQTTTLFIIIFTVFIMGSTTRPLLTYLKIVIDDNDKRQTKISDKSPSDYRLRLKSNEQLFASLNNQMIKWLQSGYRYFRQMLIQPPSHQNQIDFSHDDDWNDGEIYDPSNKFGNESDFHHPYTMIIISHVLSNK